jgi:surface polysaccharide O-acyltransferase-like enzyme
MRAMNKQYHAIDIMKYISSIMVIIVHTSPLLPYSEFGNFVVINILGRFAVPFFFISSGFFVSMKSREDPAYFRKYIVSLIKTYMFWSILYIPCGYQWLQNNMDIPYFLYPLALLLGFLYLGTYYHLWYMPALIFSLLVVEWYTKQHRHRPLLSIAFILFCIGSLETYYGIVTVSPVQAVIDNYMTVFFTTRNGLFFGLFFVACGYYLSKQERWLHVEHKKLWLSFCLLILMAEAYILNQTDTLNFNFLIMLAPCTIFLFLCLRDLSINWSIDYRRLRSYSELYYFTHAFFLVLIPMVLDVFHAEEIFEEQGWLRFFSVMLCTHVLTWLIYEWKQRTKKAIRS